MGSTGSRDRFIGRTVGQYRLIEKIGSGGMGTVYKGTHVEIPGLVVAVKLLKLNFVDDGSLRQRFRDEAAIIAQLGERSPNVVQIRDYGIFEEFDAPYYMMEFLKGHSLDALSCSGQPVPLKRLIPLACQLCNGLHVAHTQGVIHRDLKPANIFLIPDLQLGERIKILDFGIAKLVSDIAATGETVGYVGTPRYSSPEQFLGLQLNQRSDLFSLGVILYELFSNTQIHKADDESFASWSHIHTRMPPPQRVPSRDPNHLMPPEAEEIVLRCLAKDPQERPSSALDVAKHLQLALRNLIHQADQQVLSNAARLADIRDWRNAVACIEAISYDSPFYVEAQIALRTWRPEAASQQALDQAHQHAASQQILDQARQYAASNQIDHLVRAVLLVSDISQDSAIRPVAQNEAAAWIERAVALAEECGRTGQWAEAIEGVQRISELPGTSQRFSERLVQWRKELAAQQTLQEAQCLADAGEYDRAIAVALAVDEGTAVTEFTRIQTTAWQTAAVQVEHQQSLDEARVLIRRDGIANLARARSAAPAIPYGSGLEAIEQAEQWAEAEDDAAGSHAATIVAGTAIKAANPTRESLAGPQSTGPTLSTPYRPEVLAATQTTQGRARKSPQSTSTQPARTAPWILAAAGVAVLVFGGGIMTLFAPKTLTTPGEVKTDGSQKALSPPVKQIFKPPQTGTRSGTEQSHSKAVRQAAVRKTEEAVKGKRDQKARKQTVKADWRRLTVAKRLNAKAARRTRPGQSRKADGPAISVSFNCYNPAVKASNYRCRNRKN